MEKGPPGTGKPKPARREVKIRLAVQLTGIRGGKGKRGERKGWAVFVPIYPTAVSTIGRSSSRLQLKTPKAFPSGSMCIQESRGLFKEAGTGLHEAIYAPAWQSKLQPHT